VSTASDAVGADPRAFVEHLGPALRQAAAVARALEGRVPNRPKADAGSEVKAALTLADSAAQETLLVALQEHFPAVALRAEEETPSVAAFPPEAADRPLVVIDPIDGTLHSYLEHRGPYAVMVGLAVRGRYEAALVALPREGLFFDGVRGGAARRSRPRDRARPVRAEASGDTVLVSHEMPEPVRERLRARGFSPVAACGGAISVAPLVPGVRAGLRLAPENVSIRGRIGVLIARAAGACALGEGAGPFPEDLETPSRALAVAAEVGDAERLLEALAPALA
jgi:fructose-1,6-bisphosphatase/inositol monophosphatase family enzyme